MFTSNPALTPNTLGTHSTEMVPLKNTLLRLQYTTVSPKLIEARKSSKMKRRSNYSQLKKQEKIPEK